MKYLIIASALLLCYSCSKNTPDEPIIPLPAVDTVSHIIELGKSSVLRNGTAWNAPFSAYYFTNDKSRFSLRSTLIQNGFEHVFSMTDISSKLGLQYLSRNVFWDGIPSTFYGVVLDQDQVLNYYRVDTTLANQYIEILHYDSINHIVEGRFQTFLEGPTTYSFLPDSIKMTEGKFHLKIKE